jgi:hypothetical protein
MSTFVSCPLSLPRAAVVVAFFRRLTRADGEQK